MFALFDAFLQILLRRRGPEDLPDSRFLLALALGAYLLCQVPVAVIMYGWTAVTAALLAADALLLAVYFWIVLQLAGHAGRYRQTLTALAGTGALLALLQAPLVWLMQSMRGPQADAPWPLTLALLLLLVWTVLVQSHVATRALERGPAVGLGVALLFVMLSFVVTSRIAPAAA
jgi:hypothetical protein